MSLIFQQQVPAASLHTLSLQGTAHTLVDLESLDDIPHVIEHAAANNLKIIPLGEGSNLVFPKRSPVLWLRAQFKHIEIVEETNDTVLVKAGAGLNWHHWVSYCLDQGWHGLENLALIPGCVGAAPIQNIGAYGVELDQFVDSVETVCIKAFDDKKPGDKLSFSREQCVFSYRDSIFKKALKDKVLVTAIFFRLTKVFKPDIRYKALDVFFNKQVNFNSKNLTAKQLFDAVVSIRRQRLPDVNASPNAGSFFKNPIVSVKKAESLRKQYAQIPIFEAGPAYGAESRKLSAAWLIEKAGLKGYESKGIQMSDQHALVLINTSAKQTAPAARSTSGEVIEMSNHVIATVYKHFGIQLTPEPRIHF